MAEHPIDSAPPGPGGSGTYQQSLLGKLDGKFLDSVAGRRVLVILVALILLAGAPKFFRNILTIEESQYRGLKRKTALGRWLPDPLALSAGEHPYGYGHWFPGTPFVLLTLSPLSHLAGSFGAPQADGFTTVGVTMTACLWLIAKYGAIAATVWLLIAAARGSPTGMPVGVLLMAAVFGLRPLVGDIQHGNLNIFLLLELALAWYLFVKGRDMAAGVIIALAIVTKVTPGLLLVYFCYKRQWRVLAGALVGLAVFVMIVPALFTGVGTAWDLHVGWFNQMIRPYLVEGYITFKEINQSLPGFFIKWFHLPVVLQEEWPEAASHAAVTWIAKTFPTVQADEAVAYVSGEIAMAKPDSLLPKVIIRGANLLILVLLAWLCRTRITARTDPRLLLELSLVLLAMLLLSERTWKHHMVTLGVIYLATWLVLACLPWSKIFRAIFGVGLVCQWLMLHASGDRLLYAGVITLGLLLAFAQNALLLRRLQRAPPEELP